MSRVLALASLHVTERDLLRALVTWGCAIALIAAGRFIPL